jgi:hypothetical protein
MMATEVMVLFVDLICTNPDCVTGATHPTDCTCPPERERHAGVLWPEVFGDDGYHCLPQLVPASALRDTSWGCSDCMEPALASVDTLLDK